MYKVLIVDDEILVRVGLKTTIDWEEIGFTVTAEASNGEQGYEQYKKHGPDVLITDIKMPKRDGLWLIEEIRKDNPDIKILVLTCYDEFAYARKALKMGADDYILKSEVEDEELVTVMKKIKSKIDSQRKIKNIQMKVENNRNDMKRALLNDMIKSGFNLDDKIIERCAEVEFTIFDTRLAFAGFEVDEEITQDSSKLNNLKQINTAIGNIIFDRLQEKEVEYLYNNTRNNYVFLMSAKEMNTTDLTRIFQLVSKAVTQYFDIPLKIVYTDPFADLEKISMIYRDFMDKAQIFFYEKPKCAFITNVNNISFKEINLFDLKNQYSHIFNDYIGRGDYDSVKKLNTEVSDYFGENNINPMTVKIFYSNLIGDIFNSYGQLFEGNEEIMNYEYYHYNIVNADRLRKVVNIFSDFTAKVMDGIRHSRESNTKLIINKALNYINNNYDHNISLEDIASKLNLSKHYLCSVFKEEMGETTSSYINRLRIEKAKKLLLKKDYKIKEIFEEVGFSNQYYFSKVFKKITGMTISEYRAEKNESARKQRNAVL